MSRQASAAARAVRDSIRQAILLLKQKKARGGLSRAELDEINDRIRDLEEQLAVSRAEVASIGQRELPEPTDEQFAIIKQNAKDLEAETARNLTVAAIIRIVNETVNVRTT